MLILSNHDTIELGYGYTIESTHLVDSIVAARHKLDSRIVNILRSLKLQPMAYRDLVGKLEEQEIDRAQGEGLILTLNSIGALKIRRRIGAVKERAMLTTRALLLHRKITAVQQRDRTNFYSLVLALSRATGFLLLLWCFACSLVVAIGTISMSYFIALSVGAYVTLLISLICHEYAHVMILGEAKKTSAIVRNGWRIGILHEQQSAQRELFSAVLGPLAGALTALGLCTLLHTITHEPVWLAIGWVFVGCHFLSLLPSFGDGWTIVRAFEKGAASI